MFIELTVVFALVIYLSWEKLFGKSRPKTFPPGPYRWPFVGNLPQILTSESLPMEVLKEWREAYGNIVGLRLGDFDVVILSDYDVIKEAFSMPEFSGRPKLGQFVVFSGEHRRGLLASEGPGWAEQRRFALRNLRDLGFGKKSMEELIQEDVVEFIESLKSECGKPVYIQKHLNLVVLNTLWKIVGGESFGHCDQKLVNIFETFNTLNCTDTMLDSWSFLSWFRRVAPKLSGWERFTNAAAKAKSFVRTNIEEHKYTFDRNEMRDFIDVYLNEIIGAVDRNSSFWKESGNENIEATILNLLVSGPDTTSKLINWSFFFLAHHPRVQKKMFEEIESFVGTSRLPNVDDRGLMIYTEAVMLETLRFSSIIPLSIFHAATEDVIFLGYAVPKGTAIIANLWAVHHDKELWGDPKEFRPERFISEDGKRLEKTEHVIAFSTGKRACIGETLVKTEFFLFLTGIVQTFVLEFPQKKGELEFIPTLQQFPPPYNVGFKERERGFVPEA